MFHIPIRTAGGTSDHFKISGKGNTTYIKKFGPQKGTVGLQCSQIIAGKRQKAMPMTLT